MKTIQVAEQFLISSKLPPLKPQNITTAYRRPQPPRDYSFNIDEFAHALHERIQFGQCSDSVLIVMTVDHNVWTLANGLENRVDIDRLLTDPTKDDSAAAASAVNADGQVPDFDLVRPEHGTHRLRAQIGIDVGPVASDHLTPEIVGRIIGERNC